MLKGGKYLSKFDLKRSYHQIKLHEDFKPFTEFTTMEGIFQFTRMPFGLASATSAFQRMMVDVFKGMNGIIFFQDDI